MKRSTLFFFLSISAFLLTAADTVVPAANWTLTDFIVYLGSSGGAAAFASFVLERLPWFKTLTSDQRSYTVLVVSVVVALVAAAILKYVPADVLTQMAAWFQIVYGVAFTWMLSQVAHKTDPAAAKA